VRPTARAYLGLSPLLLHACERIHGFTLQQTQGGSFQQDLTSVPSEGSQTVAVKLTKGEWTFYCPPHKSQMNGSFTVG
jgi:hypothetical protein